jgi:Ca2+:H+ antiporter
VVPLLVLGSFVLGPAPMPLVLNALELAGLAAAAVLAWLLTRRGETTLRQGALLLAVYAGLVVAFALA